LPPWLKIDSFKELKILLWETIIVTMVVFTLTQIASLKNTLTLDVLILPGTVFILSISLYFVKKEDKH
jgi:predicted membrane channel-forming protein YqfA (hemolysin III family)